MSPQENLHDAIGMMAYLVAIADGKIQREERELWEKIVSDEIRSHDKNFNISSISFKLLEKDKLDADMIYDWVIKEMKNNSHYLSPELKLTALRILEKIAKAIPPITVSEKNYISRFRKDITSLHGDPVYYNS
ncbi:MAG: hypothetical protein ACK452_08545 [Bacteroidota bacterium]|jgi:uncharacterized tellurite resistance protein B-like protein